MSTLDKALHGDAVRRGDAGAESTRFQNATAAGAPRATPRYDARSPGSVRAGAVGLVVARDPEILASDTFFPGFIAGCERVLAAHGMGLILHTATSEEAERTAYEHLAAGRADGVILLDVRVGDPRFALMAELGLPAVVLSARAPGLEETWGLPTIYSDDSSAVEELVELFAEAGHTRIAHVSGPSRFIHARVRGAAFSAAMRARGLDDSLVVEGDFTAESGRDATAQLLDLPQPPTGILYANDQMAIAGLSLANSHGIRVPQELSLTGYDDNALAAHLSPGLTTVATADQQRGELALTTLLSVIAGERPENVLAVHTTVVPRGSVAPPPQP
ncbi:LacI family DNA-binding transcriptional regulator [Brachybacterium vulturis]|uniref:LacI family DNA-binding transcriptional regulator n=1 Tax=Brachybacterium vulturis TaxID=2017484 RepID=UPI003736301F